jgi:hypothetical protein
MHAERKRFKHCENLLVFLKCDASQLARWAKDGTERARGFQVQNASTSR